MGQYKPLLGSLSQQYLCQIKSTQMASNLSIWSLVLFTLCFISCTGYINFSLQPALPSALCWNNTEPVTLMEAPRLQTSPSTAVLSFLVVHCTGIEQIPEIQTFTELFVRALCTVQAHESTCDINAAWFKWLGRVSFIWYTTYYFKSLSTLYSEWIHPCCITCVESPPNLTFTWPLELLLSKFDNPSVWDVDASVLNQKGVCLAHCWLEPVAYWCVWS